MFKGQRFAVLFGAVVSGEAGALAWMGLGQHHQTQGPVSDATAEGLLAPRGEGGTIFSEQFTDLAPFLGTTRWPILHRAPVLVL